jgi:hypothetical protein
VNEFSASSAPLRFYLLHAHSCCFLEVVNDSMQTINQFDFMEIDQPANCFASGVLKRRDAEIAEKVRE